MNLAQWRQDPNATESAQKLLNNKTFQKMMEVAKNELPTNRVLPAVGTEQHSFVYAYGVEVGYRQCLATLETMASPILTPENVEATFETQPE